MLLSLNDPDPAEPDDVDLTEIEDEWPLIAAELDLLEAEIMQIEAEDRGGSTVLARRRVRRAAARVTRVAAELAAHRCGWLDLHEAGMSDCRFGCKIFACRVCGTEQVLHSATYGCRVGLAA